MAHKRHAANKKESLQAKKRAANRKGTLQPKSESCKQKRKSANKKRTLQTKKVHCNQKTIAENKKANEDWTHFVRDLVSGDLVHQDHNRAGITDLIGLVCTWNSETRKKAVPFPHGQETN